MMMPRWGQRGELWASIISIGSPKVTPNKNSQEKNSSCGKAALRLDLLVTATPHSKHVAFLSLSSNEIMEMSLVPIMCYSKTALGALLIPWDIFPTQNKDIQHLTFILGSVLVPVPLQVMLTPKNCNFCLDCGQIFFSFFFYGNPTHMLKKRIRMPLSHSLPPCLNSSLQKQLLLSVSYINFYFMHAQANMLYICIYIYNRNHYAFFLCHLTI